MKHFRLIENFPTLRMTVVSFFVLYIPADEGITVTRNFGNFNKTTRRRIPDDLNLQGLM
jgi:hypothetical protein